MCSIYIWNYLLYIIIYATITNAQTIKDVKTKDHLKGFY